MNACPADCQFKLDKSIGYTSIWTSIAPINFNQGYNDVSEYKGQPQGKGCDKNTRGCDNPVSLQISFIYYTAR